MGMRFSFLRRGLAQCSRNSHKVSASLVKIRFNISREDAGMMLPKFPTEPSS
jgi:hypothetical protein